MPQLSKPQAESPHLAKWVALAAIAMTTYYLGWRLTTFNPAAFTFSAILYGAEVYGFMTSLLFFFMVWKPAARSPVQPEAGLTVDVFIPTLDESPELLRKTVLACLRMGYPHQTYLLDDGGREEVRALARELGCGYLAPPDNAHARAENLNYALRHTHGEFVAVFDADHVPQPDFLGRLLGYFKDPRVAFVQTPQDFYNIDSFQHRRTRDNKVWTEQSLFFAVIQPGKDRWNAAIFCGSCAVLRRTALYSIGGFATGTVTEELHTSIKLHARGWKSVYHNESLAYGIAPPVLFPFQQERLRWGEGAMQVLIRDNPLLIRGLALPQRLCYFATMASYLEGFQRAIYYLAPIFVLFTGLAPVNALDSSFWIRFVPYLTLSLWAHEEMARGFGKTLLTEQYGMLRFFISIKSFLGLFMGRRLKFRAMSKETHAKPDLGLLLPQSTIIVLSGCAIWYGVAQLAAGTVATGVIVAGICWALFNSGIGLAAVCYALAKVQKRKNFRFPANFTALAGIFNRGERLVVVENLHEGGALVRAFEPFDVGSVLLLRLSYISRTVEVIGKVMHVRSDDERGVPLYHHGIAFEEVSQKERDAIVDFNFSCLVKKMMTELALVRKTL